MRLQSSNPGVKFQIQEVMVVMGVVSHGMWSPTMGIVLVTLGILGAISRTALEIAEKNKIAEVKEQESEKIKNATSALADAFNGFGSRGSTGEN